MTTTNVAKSAIKPASSPESLCSQIKSCLTASAAELTTACQLIVTLMDEHKWLPDTVAKQLGVSPVLVRNLERAGRQQLAPELVWGGSQGRRCLARLPLPEQHRWLAQPLEVITTAGDELQVSIDNLTPELCRQVFDGSRVRNAGEQRAWLETSQRKQNAVTLVPDYEVRNHKLRIGRGNMPPIELTRSQLVRILADMEG